MKESMQEPPAAGEYVEVTKSDIRDSGDAVEFEFRFAAPVSNENMDAFWANPESTVKKTVIGKLSEKGWVSSDGASELVPVLSVGRVSSDGKIWKFNYHKDNPNPSKFLQ